MNAHPDREELMAWCDGEVSAERAGALASHTIECAECRGFTASLASVSTRVSQWTVEPAPVTLQIPQRSAVARVVSRRTMWWAAAAMFVVGILATVRVDCAPASTCERHTFRLSFMPADRSPDLPEQARALSPAEQAAFEKYWLSLPYANGNPRSPDQTLPRVLVYLFHDWQCPACRAEYRAYGPVFADIQRRFPSRVVIEYLDYPLNKRCNANVPVELHPAACDAAAAVRLAKEHGTEAAMIDWLFANQESLTPVSVREAAATIGRIPDFDARAASPAMRSRIERDTAIGARLGVQSTPTCFINGVLARDAGNNLLSAEEIRVAIEIELRRIR